METKCTDNSCQPAIKCFVTHWYFQLKDKEKTAKQNLFDVHVGWHTNLPLGFKVHDLQVPHHGQFCLLQGATAISKF